MEIACFFLPARGPRGDAKPDVGGASQTLIDTKQVLLSDLETRLFGGDEGSWTK